MEYNSEILTVLKWKPWAKCKPPIIETGFYTLGASSPFLAILENTITHGRTVDLCYLVESSVLFYQTRKPVSGANYIPIWWAEMPYDLAHDEKFNNKF